ncbi:hypothetical protein BAE44_0006782, partial [Dichanthelium oligosanthes]
MPPPPPRRSASVTTSVAPSPLASPPPPPAHCRRHRLPFLSQRRSQSPQRNLFPSPISTRTIPGSMHAISSAAGGMLRARLRGAARVRGGSKGAGRWTTPGHEERPKGYIFNRPPPPPGESRK